MHVLNKTESTEKLLLDHEMNKKALRQKLKSISGLDIPLNTALLNKNHQGDS